MSLKQILPFLAGVVVGAALACNDRGTQAVVNTAPSPAAPIVKVEPSKVPPAAPSPRGTPATLAASPSPTAGSPESIRELEALAESEATKPARPRRGGGAETRVIGGDGYL